MAAEMLEKFDLTQGTFGQDFLAEYICNLLDCNTLPSLNIRGSTTKK